MDGAISILSTLQELLRPLFGNSAQICSVIGLFT